MINGKMQFINHKLVVTYFKTFENNMCNMQLDNENVDIFTSRRTTMIINTFLRINFHQRKVIWLRAEKYVGQ